MTALCVRRVWVRGLTWAAILYGAASQAQAIGLLYADPGWFYAYEGDEAFYNDPDGPHPDYVGGQNTNAPGGQGGTAALVDPANNGGIVAWMHASSNWDGSAPGDPLGGVAGNAPPLLPPAPGGVGAFSEDSTTFLRIQDPGRPQNWGWPDKGAQACPDCAAQEGSNRKIQFRHPLINDTQFSGDEAILDNGITLTFRTRLATAATGPIDDIYVEGGPSASPGGAPVPWPANGLGYQVSNNGRGMFHLTQTNALGLGQQMAFGLVDQDTIFFEGLDITKTGLVMNNRNNPEQSVDTGDATDVSLNVVEIPDEDLENWHEFWITIEAIQLDALGSPIPDPDGNTHEVNVYTDGAIEPETFQIVLALENEFGSGAHLGLGLSSGTRQGAYDIDFFAYREGVFVPEKQLTRQAADFDEDGDVDADDYSIWQAGFGTPGPATSNTGDANGDGAVRGDDFLVWQGQFGSVAGAAATAGHVPEPATAVLLLGVAGVVLLARRSW